MELFVGELLDSLGLLASLGLLDSLGLLAEVLVDELFEPPPASGMGGGGEEPYPSEYQPLPLRMKLPVLVKRFA